MTKQALIVGGGIGGLAAAIAAARAGWEARIFERADRLSEAGAGIQLGPNASRILTGWGLRDRLEEVAARPDHLRIHDATDGRPLAALELGAGMARRYGAPYLTLHRADLQQLLLDAARARDVTLELACAVERASVQGDTAWLHARGRPLEGDVLIGADGLWSAVRACVIQDGPARSTGHAAFRALMAQRDLPARLRGFDVKVWLGPRLHAVCYPVQGGERLNVVVLAESRGDDGNDRDWDRAATFAQMQAVTASVCPELRELLIAMPRWRRWSLHDRAPAAGPDALARGPVALIGDAAHPMLPYLAQGAAMAIEDARELERSLRSVSDGIADVPLALRRYALNRVQRVAKVQRTSRRNAWVFHASGPVRWARDLSLRLLPRRLLDQPWLYQDLWGR